MNDDDVVPWKDVPQADRENFTAMLNQRFDAGLSVEDAADYYGNREKIERDLGKMPDDDAPACGNCFQTITPQDMAELKRTGRCPHCGEDLRE